MPLARLRSLFSVALVAALLVLGGAFYLEFALGLAPCPLCQTQRFFLGAFAIVCLWGALRPAAALGARLSGGLALGLALAGALLAARQVWLQGRTLPGETECLHPLGYLIEHASLGELLEALLLGTRECVVMTWSFLDLSVPEWSLLAFLALAGLALTYLLSALGAGKR